MLHPDPQRVWWGGREGGVREGGTERGGENMPCVFFFLSLPLTVSLK